MVSHAQISGFFPHTIGTDKFTGYSSESPSGSCSVSYADLPILVARPSIVVGDSRPAAGRRLGGRHGPCGLVDVAGAAPGALGAHAARFHCLPRVVSNLGVYDFETPDLRMRVRSVHHGVTVDEVVAATGFDLVVPDDVATTRVPTDRKSVV